MPSAVTVESAVGSQRYNQLVFEILVYNCIHDAEEEYNLTVFLFSHLFGTADVTGKKTLHGEVGMWYSLNSAYMTEYT